MRVIVLHVEAYYLVTVTKTLWLLVETLIQSVAYADLQNPEVEAHKPVQLSFSKVTKAVT